MSASSGRRRAGNQAAPKHKRKDNAAHPSIPSKATPVPSVDPALPATAMQLVRLPLAAIHPNPNARPINQAKVDALADSMKEIGLKTAITLRRVHEEAHAKYEVVAGGHRYLAARKLGWISIQAIVTDDDELHRELWTIDENLVRAELGAADEAKALARRKQIYEALHPETKAQVAGGKGRHRSAAEKNSAAESFAKNTAKRTGKTERHVRQVARRGLEIAPDVLDAVNGTSMDKPGELDVIAKLSHADQRLAVEMVNAGEAANLREAVDKVGEPKASTVPAKNRGRAKSRVARWSKACDDAVAALGELQQLQEEYQGWFDALPENLQGGATADKLQEIVGIDIESAIAIVTEAQNAEPPQGFGRD